MLGKRCTIHARSGRVAANAARAGFDWVIHASIMTEEELGVLVECGTPINPTLSLLVNMIEWGPEFGASEAVINGFSRELASARSEEHTSELQSLMRISYDVFCLKKQSTPNVHQHA